MSRAYFLKQSEAGGQFNGVGRCKSEEAGWMLAVDRGGRIAPVNHGLEKQAHTVKNYLQDGMHISSRHNIRLDMLSHTERQQVHCKLPYSF